MRPVYQLMMILRLANRQFAQLSAFTVPYSFSELNKKPDLYSLLQLSPNAKPEQIRYNYFKLISTYHNKAAQNQDSLKHSKLLNEAYAILSNEKLKAKYDKEKGYGQASNDRTSKAHINLSREDQMSQKYNEARRGFSAIIGDQKTRTQERLIAAVMISVFIMTVALILNGKNYKNTPPASASAAAGSK